MNATSKVRGLLSLSGCGAVAVALLSCAAPLQDAHARGCVDSAGGVRGGGAGRRAARRRGSSTPASRTSSGRWGSATRCASGTARTGAWRRWSASMGATWSTASPATPRASAATWSPRAASSTSTAGACRSERRRRSASPRWPTPTPPAPAAPATWASSAWRSSPSASRPRARSCVRVRTAGTGTSAAAAPKPRPRPRPGPGRRSAAPPAASAPGSAEGAPTARSGSPRRERPGLGTQFGEAVHSPIHEVSFVRENPHQPSTILGLRYNDRPRSARPGGGCRWPLRPRRPPRRLAARHRRPLPGLPRPLREPPRGWNR